MPTGARRRIRALFPFPEKQKPTVFDHRGLRMRAATSVFIAGAATRRMTAMPGSYPKGWCSRSPFLITPYVPGAGGALVAEMPTRCPRAAPDQGCDCKLSVHHRRYRKAGPPHPLAVARCAVHEGAFTLYPPGFAPYLRQPLQRLSPEGRELALELRQDGQPAEAWRGTVFEAAVDASGGHAWPRSTQASAAGPADGSWGKQCRRLQDAAKLVGIASGLADKVREAISATLSVGMLVLQDLMVARGYRAIGQAVCGVLQRLRGGARRAMQLSVCGHLVGRWGEPWRWDPERRLVERSPFRRGGTTADG